MLTLINWFILVYKDYKYLSTLSANNNDGDYYVRQNKGISINRR